MIARAWNMSMGHIRVKMARANLGRVLNASGGSVKLEIGVFLFVYYFL